MSASILKLPFLHDHHSHVSFYAALAGLPDLNQFPGGETGKAQALELLSSLPHKGLNLVMGWHSDRFTFSQAELASLPPIMIVNSSIHGFALTKAAEPIIKELWPELSAHATDIDWIERSIGATFCFYGRVAGLDQAKLAAFMTKMEAIGIWSLEDLSTSGDEALEIIASSPYADRIRSWVTPEVYRSLSPAGKSRCSGVKLYLDGALGGRSAALDAPFLGGEKGLLLYSEPELESLLREISGFGAAFTAHAIGHRAIEQAISLLERLDAEGIGFPALRLEHAQLIDRSQARRAKALGIILSMQPNFNSDSVDFTDRLSSRHLAANDPFRMLIDEAGFVPGEDLVFGSDGMPHGPDYALQWSLFPAFDGQKLTPEEFAAGYAAPSWAAVPAAGGIGSSFEVDADARRVKRISSLRH
jgi:Predicted metal-dependent hydrolase with the TIM-barrel fold